MRVSDNLMQSIASFIGTIVFYTIPPLKIILGEPLSPVPFGISIVAGIVFAIIGGYFLDKYKKERRKQKITDDEDTDEFLDTKLQEPCPSCKSKLMMISRLDGKLLNDAWIGLIYCMKCNFEISKERWDDGEREP